MATATPQAYDPLEFNAWKDVYNTERNAKNEAYVGASTTAVVIGGEPKDADSLYDNQQGTPFENELKVDALFGKVKYDPFADAATAATTADASSVEFGYPPTVQLQDYISKAALGGGSPGTTPTTKDTIPAQRQLDLLEAFRKSRNNWMQRRQQLLTYRQLLWANHGAIDANFYKLSNGEPIDLGTPAGQST